VESDDNALLRHTHFVSWTLEVLRLRMLELEVVPEHGLISDVVEFILGMHFSQAVATIQSLVGSVKGVQILYSDKDPLTVDLVINLTNDGIKLIFDPINQRLKTIEVHDLTLLKLKYGYICLFILLHYLFTTTNVLIFK